MLTFLQNPGVAAIAGGVVGSLVTVLITWMFSTRSRKQDQLRDRVNKIESEIRQFENIAIRYWVSELGDEDASDLERQIKRIKTSIGRELKRLRQNKFPCSKDCDVLLYKVNRAATSAPFEERPHLPDRLIVPQIQDAIDALVDELRDCLSVV